jgi:ribonuclease BN (tRNA processing enzyme)
MNKMKINPIQDSKLSLTNSGYLSLFFIGVGSAFTDRLNQTNLIIIKGNDHLLVDCGTKTPQALRNIGFPITAFENILITHSHSDHIGGLEELLLKSRYINRSRKKPNFYINETYQHILWDMSLRGGCAFNEENANDVLAFHDFVNIIRPVYLHEYPRETMEVQIGGINIKIFRTKHIPGSSNSWESSFWSSGIIIDNKILFTADTRFDFDLLEGYDSIFDLKFIFHDCQFFNGGIHASLDELSRLPLKFKNKMILMHYGDNWEKYEEKIKREKFIGLAKQQVYYDFDF